MKRTLFATLACLLLSATPASATIAGIGGNGNGGALGAGYRGVSVPYPVDSTLYDQAGATEAQSAYYDSFALTAGGQVADAGANEFGQLANGNRINQLFPVIVPALSEVMQLATGGSHVLVLLSGGQVLSWGGDWGGVCGCGVKGGEHGIHVPTPVLLPGPAVQVFAGGANAGAVLANGEVYVWGENKVGQLALPPTAEGYDVPVKLPVPGPVRSVVFGGNASIGGHLFVILQTGEVWAAGGDQGGQLCVGPAKLYSTLVKLPLEHIVAVASDITHALYLAEDGTVFACGKNEYGQVGDGTTETKTRPTKVLTGAQHIAAGLRWSFASANGVLFGWGRNDRQQLGNGSNVNQLSPAPNGLTGVSLVQAGEFASFAVTSGPVAAPAFRAVVNGAVVSAGWDANGASAWYFQWRLKNLPGTKANPWLGRLKVPAVGHSASTPALAPGRYQLWLYGGGVHGGWLTEATVG